jgi:asparagine synthase (glutamine-hydrolysing)
MTALAGLWRFDGRSDAAEGCGRMLKSQELYGPHAGDQWSNGDVALGRRLMRMLPEDTYDRQPLIGGDGRYVLVADVRLDNRDELLGPLSISAVDARTLSDAAILLAAIERWEELCLERLIGDYAFVLWDGARRRLLLARDPLGQRPLHYHRGNKFFALASMPKGLHALAEVPYAPDEDRIAEFLALMIENGPQSFFQGIERVEPGHVVTVTPTGLVTRRHWQPTRSRIVLNGAAEYAEAVRNLLDQAVRCRLRGAEDVGATLSGGFDSAAVAATAARLLAPSGRRVIAYTAVPREGYEGQAPRNRIVDEGPYAAAIAAQYPNMEHVLIRSHDRSPLDDLDRSFFLYDRPFLSLCNAVWGNSICDAARKRQLTVLLVGNIGNLGLSYNGLELLPELFRNGRWLCWLREARALVTPGGGGCGGAACWPTLWDPGARLPSGSGSTVLYTGGLSRFRTILPSIRAGLPSSIFRLAPRRAVLILSTAPGKTVLRSGFGLFADAIRATTTKAHSVDGTSTCAIRPPTCGCSSSVWRCQPNSSFPAESGGRSPGVPCPIACRGVCSRNGAGACK